MPDIQGYSKAGGRSAGTPSATAAAPADTAGTHAVPPAFISVLYSDLGSGGGGCVEVRRPALLGEELCSGMGRLCMRLIAVYFAYCDGGNSSGSEGS